jgi:Indigoidine synthase A like protein
MAIWVVMWHVSTPSFQSKNQNTRTKHWAAMMGMPAHRLMRMIPSGRSCVLAIRGHTHRMRLLTTSTTTKTRGPDDNGDAAGDAGDSSSGLWNVYPPVADALRCGRPVVALESTIIAHGLPWPHNLQLAREVATILRDRGVEPATIGTLLRTLAT